METIDPNHSNHAPRKGTKQLRITAFLLRAIGLLDLIAFIAVVSPTSTIASIHAALGLGTFPSDPIVAYLARNASLWYVSYGVLLWILSFDVARYSPLIKAAAWLMIAQGIIVMVIDLTSGMPSWWTAIEGPCCSGLGIGLWLVRPRHLPPNENGGDSKT
jgi:hypothetical protein